MDLDCFTNLPPSVSDWRKVYQGPLLLVPASYTQLLPLGQVVYDQVKDYQTRHYVANAAVQQQQSSSSSIMGIMTTTYHQDRIKLLPSCNTTCLNGGGKLNRPCVGGFYDLLAWEVWDFLDHAIVIMRNDKDGNDHNNKSNHRFEQLRHWEIPIEPPVDYRNDGITKERHWCTKPTISRPYDPFAPIVPVYYQCEGPLYDNFTVQLHQYVNQVAAVTSETPSSWGKRQWPVPAHQKILLFGNSHTRQVTESLLCMYQDDSVLESIVVNAFSFRYTLRNNSTLVLVVNSPIPYSTRWVEMLYNETGIPLNDFDAVVLGMLNECGNTDTFSQQMEAISAQMDHVDCLHIAPPTTTDWSHQFTTGPIIFMPMLSSKAKIIQKYTSEIKALRQTGLDRVSFLDARKHVLAVGVECASYNRTGSSDCLNRIGPTHRCEGRKGGHPELVAWDLVERWYEVLLP